MSVLEQAIGQRFGGEWPRSFTLDLSEAQACILATVASPRGIAVDALPSVIRHEADRRGYVVHELLHRGPGLNPYSDVREYLANYAAGRLVPGWNPPEPEQQCRRCDYCLQAALDELLKTNQKMFYKPCESMTGFRRVRPSYRHEAAKIIGVQVPETTCYQYTTGGIEDSERSPWACEKHCQC